MADPTNIGDFATFDEALSAAWRYEGRLCACTIAGEPQFVSVGMDRAASVPTAKVLSAPQNFTMEIGSIEGVRFLDAPRRGGRANG